MALYKKRCSKCKKVTLTANPSLPVCPYCGKMYANE